MCADFGKKSNTFYIQIIQNVQQIVRLKCTTRTHRLIVICTPCVSSMMKFIRNQEINQPKQQTNSRQTVVNEQTNNNNNNNIHPNMHINIYAYIHTIIVGLNIHAPKT